MREGIDAYQISAQDLLHSMNADCEKTLIQLGATRRMREDDTVWDYVHRNGFVSQWEVYIDSDDSSVTILDYITHLAISGIARKITGGRDESTYTLKDNEESCPILGGDAPAAVLCCAKDAIAFAEALRFEQVLEERMRDRGETSIPQVVHLAALAYGGEVRILQEYLEAMQRGKTFGFVPMVTSGFVQRALKVGGEQLFRTDG